MELSSQLDLTMPPKQFQQLLLQWFVRDGRKDLPWQQHINPYRVWLSEIMLQQTQVNNVIPYFNRFISRFPDLTCLAQAELDEVLQYWSGLGYYARARNLHKTAQIIWNNGGVFPLNIQELQLLPGIGRSTAGAILSIACGQSQAILDGNVKRVFARFHAVSGWPGDSKVAGQLWQISQLYTSEQNAAAYTQAIMDLGATLCTRSKPNCLQCPVNSGCKAFALNTVKHYPEAKPSKQIPVKQLYMLLLENSEKQILLTKRPPVGIWGGLWSLPEFNDLIQLQSWCISKGYQLGDLQSQAQQRHTFSHYHLDYTPIYAKVLNPINNVMEANLGLWYKVEEFDNLGLPAPIKRLLQSYKKKEQTCPEL